MKSREDLETTVLEGLLRSICKELGEEGLGINSIVHERAEELAKISVANVLDDEEDEDQMEELCADMDTFYTEE